MADKLTGVEVWNAAIAENKVLENDSIREVLRPFIEATPEVLGNFLSLNLSFEVLVKTKVAFLSYCIDNGFVEKIAEVMGYDFGFVSEAVGLLLGNLCEIAEDVVAFLEENGVSEDQVMLGEKVGLNEENKAKYKSGILTVADVLRIQPSVIIGNENN